MSFGNGTRHRLFLVLFLLTIENELEGEKCILLLIKGELLERALVVGLNHTLCGRAASRRRKRHRVAVDQRELGLVDRRGGGMQIGPQCVDLGTLR